MRVRVRVRVKACDACTSMSVLNVFKSFMPTALNFPENVDVCMYGCLCVEARYIVVVQNSYYKHKYTFNRKRIGLCMRVCVSVSVC